jgi:hypothetical protein
MKPQILSMELNITKKLSPRLIQNEDKQNTRASKGKQTTGVKRLARKKDRETNYV